MVLVDVLEESLDEAAFRWVQWERALVAPDFTLAETAEREERLLAYLEGLEDADALDTVVRPTFDSEEAPRISAAAHALLGLGEVDEVLVRLRGAEAPVRAALLRALEVSEAPGLGARLLELLKLEDATLQAGVLEALAFRGQAPAEVLAHFFTHDEPRTRVAALRGALPLPVGRTGHHPAAPARWRGTGNLGWDGRGRTTWPGWRSAPPWPRDFDERFFHAAPDGLRALTYLQGGEPVVLEGPRTGYWPAAPSRDGGRSDAWCWTRCC